MPNKNFPCYLVSKSADCAVRGEITRRDVAELPAGELLIEVEWSSLNYKDSLSATGNPGVTRKFPHVPGIDAAGTVVDSQSAAFEAGDKVIVTGHDQGQNTWGGWAGMVRVPAAWAIPLPARLTTREAMLYGTAGLTAGQCVDALIRGGVDPGGGDVVVTGASGGVGCLAVAILSRIGYQVVAVSGKPSAHKLLKELGADRIIDRAEVVDESTKPLLPAKWSGAIDTVGGQTLTTLVRSMRHGGLVAACGLVGGTDLKLTVFPFILRHVGLQGIDSAECPSEKRMLIWEKLAGDWRPHELEKVAHETNLSGLDHHIQEILGGRVAGRVLVKPA